MEEERQRDECRAQVLKLEQERIQIEQDELEKRRAEKDKREREKQETLDRAREIEAERLRRERFEELHLSQISQQRKSEEEKRVREVEKKRAAEEAEKATSRRHALFMEKYAISTLDQQQISTSPNAFAGSSSPSMDVVAEIAKLHEVRVLEEMRRETSANRTLKIEEVVEKEDVVEEGVATEDIAAEDVATEDVVAEDVAGEDVDVLERRHDLSRHEIPKLESQSRREESREESEPFREDDRLKLEEITERKRFKGTNQKKKRKIVDVICRNPARKTQTVRESQSKKIQAANSVDRRKMAEFAFKESPPLEKETHVKFSKKLTISSQSTSGDSTSSPKPLETKHIQINKPSNVDESLSSIPSRYVEMFEILNLIF